MPDSDGAGKATPDGVGIPADSEAGKATPDGAGVPADGEAGKVTPEGGRAEKAAATGLAASEREELERLRAQVADLHSEGKARRRRLGWRLPVAILLIVVGCVLAPVSVLA